MITRQKFIELTGETPEDLLGPDWQNEVEEFMQEDNEYFHEGHQRGSCFTCKMD